MPSFLPCKEICGLGQAQLGKKGCPCLPSIHAFRLRFRLTFPSKGVDPLLGNMKSSVHFSNTSFGVGDRDGQAALPGSLSRGEGGRAC